uniref:Uncharacterized protein n=1 Tax=Rhizophora mucronata TaxID=61149 RepID=A0A2P2Q0Z1_RHIMU
MSEEFNDAKFSPISQL